MKKVARLFNGFQPASYTLFIDPDRKSKTITGEVTVTGLKKGRPSQRLTFHQNGLTVTEATIIRRDKKGEQTIAVSRINHQRKLDEVRLHTDTLLYGGHYTVTLKYKGEITDSTHGIYPCNYELDGKHLALIATDLESHHAREVFPCIDEPEAKATFTLTLASPQGEAAISNTPAQIQKEVGGKLHTTFETTPKMSTYLFSFVYGDMQHKETKTKDGVIVRVWSTKAHSLESLDFSLDVARRALEFFNDYYGVPFPLPKVDFAALPDFSAAAMENWGLITFREPFLVAEPSTASQSSRETTTYVISHELSHQWFGDLVTMKWWDDLWLNESFANVMEYVAPDTLFPDWHVWNTFVANEGLAAFRRDAIPSVQAVKTEVHDPEEINSLFDPSIVYAKGGRLINMLMNYIGEDDFRAGLKAYFTKHAYGNTTGNDLWAALGAASGKNIAAFMNTWIEQSNFPVVSVRQDGKELTLTQAHFALDPTKTDPGRRWPIPLLAASPEVPELLETAQTKLILKESDFVRINRGAIGHYIVHYENSAHMAAIATLAQQRVLSESERLMLLGDSSLLARAGTKSFAETLKLLQYYAGEDSESVWDIMALIIADARRFIDAKPELEPAIKAQIRQLIGQQYKRLGWDEKQDESPQDIKLRASILGLGVYAEHQAITAKAVTLFDAYKKDPGAVSSELRGIVFAAVVRGGVKGTFDWLLHLEETTANPDLKQELIGALTATHAEAEAKRLLGRLQDAKKVRAHDVDHWLVFLMRNRYTQDVSWKWLRDEWAWIEKTFKTDKSYDYFPRYAASALNTRARLEEYKQFFEPKVDQKSLTRNIAMGIEELETRIAWIERDLPQVAAFYEV